MLGLSISFNDLRFHITHVLWGKKQSVFFHRTHIFIKHLNATLISEIN
jgi:hypothetical protein